MGSAVGGTKQRRRSGFLRAKDGGRRIKSLNEVVVYAQDVASKQAMQFADREKMNDDGEREESSPPPEQEDHCHIRGHPMYHS